MLCQGEDAYSDEGDAAEKAEDDDDPAATKEYGERHFLLDVEFGFVDDLWLNISEPIPS
jgi:hypothetical protein